MPGTRWNSGQWLGQGSIVSFSRGPQCFSISQPAGRRAKNHSWARSYTASPYLSRDYHNHNYHYYCCCRCYQRRTNPFFRKGGTFKLQSLEATIDTIGLSKSTRLPIPVRELHLPRATGLRFASPILPTGFPPVPPCRGDHRRPTGLGWTGRPRLAADWPSAPGSRSGRTDGERQLRTEPSATQRSETGRASLGDGSDRTLRIGGELA